MIQERFGVFLWKRVDLSGSGFRGAIGSTVGRCCGDFLDRSSLCLIVSQSSGRGQILPRHAQTIALAVPLSRLYYQKPLWCQVQGAGVWDKVHCEWFITYSWHPPRWLGGLVREKRGKSVSWTSCHLPASMCQLRLRSCPRWMWMKFWWFGVIVLWCSAALWADIIVIIKKNRH